MRNVLSFGLLLSVFSIENASGMHRMIAHAGVEAATGSGRVSAPPKGAVQSLREHFERNQLAQNSAILARPQILNPNTKPSPEKPLLPKPTLEKSLAQKPAIPPKKIGLLQTVQGAGLTAAKTKELSSQDHRLQVISERAKTPKTNNVLSFYYAEGKPVQIFHANVKGLNLGRPEHTAVLQEDEWHEAHPFASQEDEWHEAHPFASQNEVPLQIEDPQQASNLEPVKMFESITLDYKQALNQVSWMEPFWNSVLSVKSAVQTLFAPKTQAPVPSGKRLFVKLLPRQ